jgi:hypothetical protein
MPKRNKLKKARTERVVEFPEAVVMEVKRRESVSKRRMSIEDARLLSKTALKVIQDNAEDGEQEEEDKPRGRARTSSNEKVTRKTLSIPGRVVRNNMHAQAAWPTLLKDRVVESLKRDVDVEGVTKYLKKFDWPEGLIQVAIESCRKIPVRFFIVDDSGSMITPDGTVIMGSGNRMKLVKATRWSELVDSIEFHAGLAEAAGKPAEFLMLNGAGNLTVCLVRACLPGLFVDLRSQKFPESGLNEFIFIASSRALISFFPFLLSLFLLPSLLASTYLFTYVHFSSLPFV